MINRIKYLLGFGLLFLFGFINYSDAYIIPIGSYGTNMINSTTQNYDIQVTRNGTFLTQFMGITKKILYIYNPGDILQYAFWADNGLIYGIYNSSNQGYFKRYFSCPVAVGTNFNFTTANCSSNTIDLTNYSGQVEIFKSFFGSLTTDDNLYYSKSISYGGSTVPGFCVGNSSLGSSLCFLFDSYSIDGVLSTRVLPNLDINVQNFGNIENQLLSDPPTVTGNDNSSSDNGGIELNSEESGINYFETNYGRDRNICYVGIDNVTDLYGTNGVSFQAGTGLSIFETFNALYGNTDLDKVYVWLNSWIINYSEWFGRDGNPLYLASYNSGTNQVDLRYDNLTFPFSGNPVAFYFMTSNFFNYVDPTGTEIVDYCNLKINNGTFEEILSNATKNNINKYTEQSNKNNGLNPDGTTIINNINFNFTGEAFEFSGYDLTYTGSTNLTDTLSGYFSFFSDLFSYSSSSSSSGTKGLTKTNTSPILPTYILWGLVLVILFKVLRKR